MASGSSYRQRRFFSYNFIVFAILAICLAHLFDVFQISRHAFP
jgi:hypothetical protein